MIESPGESSGESPGDATGPGRFAPSRDDEVIRSLSESVGGPMGSHAAGHRWWTPVRGVLLVATLCLAAGLLVKGPCLDANQDPGATGRYTALCWSDITPLYVRNGYVEGIWPFTDDSSVRARYAAGWQPPVAGYVAYAAQRITAVLSGSPDPTERGYLPVSDLAQQDDVRRETRLFTLVSWVLLAAAGLWGAALLAATGRRRAWDAAAFAAAPVLLLLWPITWDLLAATAIAAALWAHSRGHPLRTGIAIGVGACVSPLMALLLPVAVVAAARERRVVDATLVAGAAVAAWLTLALPAWLSGPSAFKVSWRGYFHAPDIGSPWLIVSQAADWSPDTSTVAVFAGTVLGATVVTGCALVWARGWSVASAGLLVLVVALLVLPTAGPSQALLVLPLAALAVPSWRALLAWQACEIVHWAMVGFFVGGALAPGSGDDAAAYWWAISMRVFGLVFLAVTAAQYAERNLHGGGVPGGGEPGGRVPDGDGEPDRTPVSGRAVAHPD